MEKEIADATKARHQAKDALVAWGANELAYRPGVEDLENGKKVTTSGKWSPIAHTIRSEKYPR